MNLNKAIKIHLICSGIIVLAGGLIGGLHQALSAAAGALIILISVGFMVWAIQRLLEKKSVALAGMVIVIKYLLLAVMLYWLTQQAWARIAWVAAGVGSVVLTAVFYSLMVNENFESKNRNDETGS